MAATYRLTFDASGNPTRIKDDFGKAAAPGVGDDFATDGFTAGSLWLDATANRVYICEAAGTGTAVWHEMTSNGLGWFDVTAYGATGDGTTNDTAAVNLAIAALNTATKGVLYFPAGTYLCSSALTTITASGLVMGDGGLEDNVSGVSTRSRVLQTSTTADLFTVTGDNAHFRDLYLENTSAGATTSDGVVASEGNFLRVDDCAIRAFQIGLDIEESRIFAVNRCYIGAASGGNNIRVRNTANPDAGDWEIKGCYLGSAISGAAILIESSGGGRIIGNKINAGNKASSKGIVMNIGSGESTSGLTIVANNIENTTLEAIDIDASGGGTYTGIQIVGNHFGLYGLTATPAVEVTAASSADIRNVSVIGNTLRTDGANANYAVELTNIVEGAVFGNPLIGFAGDLAQTTCTAIDTGGSGTAATTVEPETTFGLSSAVGSDTEYARQDHTHGSPANPVTAAAVKAVGRWEPVQFDDGSSPWPFVYSDDEIVVHFVETP